MNHELDEYYEEALSCYDNATDVSTRIKWKRSLESLVEQGATRRDRTFFKVRDMRASGMPDELIKFKLRIRRLP